MKTHFADVLARESACLAGVTDGAKLSDWRRRVVNELMMPHSPYALALRQEGDPCERADFLSRWRELIAETVDRLLNSPSHGNLDCSSAQAGTGEVDAQQTAVLILAALHGGSTLSQVAQDPWPLNAALDLALARLAVSEDEGPHSTADELPDK
jgi:hypothetical protein